MRSEAIAKRRSDSLFESAVDHFFHYQGVEQSRLWLDVHRLHAPLFSDPAVLAIYRELFEEVAGSLRGAALHVVALGPGAGSKERLLLEVLMAAGCRIRYTPLDASLELALLSADAVPAGLTDVEPIVADLSLLKTFRPWLAERAGEEMRMFTAFGIAPNFVPSVLFSLLRSVMRKSDVLIVSANLAGTGESEEAYQRACELILPQYDNAATLRWLGQVLRDWGLSDRLNAPSFRIDTVEDVRGFFAGATWNRDVEFAWEGRLFQARAGDRLRVFFSLRYTPQRLERALLLHDLELGDGRVTPSAEEGVWRITKRG